MRHGRDFEDLLPRLRQFLAFPMQEGGTLAVCFAQVAG